MKRIILNIIYCLLSFLFSIGLLSWIAIPTLDQYPRLHHMIARFEYTETVLILFVWLAIWLFLIQWQVGRISTIYLYLFYSVYLFLLFTVLFTKAKNYHSLSLDPFDIFVSDKKVILEALLNVIYFIPLGALYGLKANKLEFVTVSLLTILGIETIQYVFYIGTFALSDIYLNFMGCVIGYFVCRWMIPRFKVI